MTFGSGRNRRPDDWPSSHVRARAAISDQLDGPIAPDEAAWLADHLEACPECRLIAAAYAEQQRELWGLRERMPVPPRDLWARTAAAIESEPRFRQRQNPPLGWPARRYLAPSAVLAAALVVAVAVGTLTSSRRFDGGGTTGTPPIVAVASDTVTNPPRSAGPGPTQIPVTAKVTYLAKDPSGSFTIRQKSVDTVCPQDATQSCNTDGTTEDHPVTLDEEASTVFGSQDNSRLIVVSDPTAAESGSVSVVSLADAPSSTPTPTASGATASPSAAPSSSAPSAPPTPSAPPSGPTPTPTATPTESTEPTPSVAVSAPPGGPIEIAHDVVLVGQSAAYSPSGSWFAFTARPVDGSAGPDIFVWKVGDALATPLTTDHRSIFGSWIGDTMVGSTVVETTTGNGAGAKTELQPSSYLLDPGSGRMTALPQTGQAWRPAVDPTGRLAVYWSGNLRATTAPGYAPDAGRLVIGDWGTGGSASPDGPLPTPVHGNQGELRHETTISAGRIEDWDARWDGSGTHVAIWIADPENAAVGRLSLYAVDSFDGRIDLKAPLLDGKLANAGFAISDGQLVWVEPAADGSSDGSKVQLVAWTATGVGSVTTVTGPAIVIR
jgi:hypothetical protein